MKKVVIFLIIGIVLAVGVIVTGNYGLSRENIEIYEQAVALQGENNNFGFQGFSLTDYPVAFYDGDKDYVIVWENDSYSIESRQAAINSIVATAYPVEGHFEVLTPTVEKMSSLISLMAGEGGYGKDEHVATLWHEAFHCWQLTHFTDQIERIGHTSVEEGLIAENADTNEQAVSLFKQQSALLEKAVKTDDVDEIKEYILEYKKLEEERKRLLPDEVEAAEDYYTRVEGTACYIEACVYKLQHPDSFEGKYLEGISQYSGGSGKYYKAGMAMCMILDKLNGQWKNDYDFSKPLINLIYQELEIGNEI